VIRPLLPPMPRVGRKMRSSVERFFGWLKSFRRIIIRYERLASTYKVLATIAPITIHLRYGILR
jgi:transposase